MGYRLNKGYSDKQTQSTRPNATHEAPAAPENGPLSVIGGDLNRVSENEPLDYAPEVDLYELGTRFVLQADLAGVDEKDVDLAVNDDRIEIFGRRHSRRVDIDDPSAGVVQRERRLGHFRRMVALPVQVDASKAECTLERGLLTVILPKAVPSARTQRTAATA